MLRGRQVVLRPICREDVSHFHKWFNDQDVTKYLTVDPPITVMALQTFLADAAKDTSEMGFMVDMLADGGTIGSVRLKNINLKHRSAEFSIVIGEKELWGKGLGTEALRMLISHGFRHLGLHRISSEVFALNEISLRMHRKLGFREEGYLREAWYKNGGYHDVTLFGLLDSEWQGGAPLITSK